MVEQKTYYDWIIEALKEYPITSDNIDFSISDDIIDYKPLTSNDYQKLKSIKSIKNNSWKTLSKELLGEIFPKTLYHGSSKIFDKFDLDHIGYHGQNSGKGAYLSNNPERSRNYGKKINKFFLNRYANLIPEYEALSMLDYTEHPWFTKDGTLPKEQAHNRFNKYLNTKGYIGYKDNLGWEKPTFDYVIFNENDLKPANTPLQRFVNRIPTKTLGKMANKLIESPAIRFGGKLLNRVATPMMILEGLSQPVGEGSDIVPQYPVNNTLRGYIYYNE